MTVLSQIVVCKQLPRVGLELAALGLREKRLDIYMCIYINIYIYII